MAKSRVTRVNEGYARMLRTGHASFCRDTGKNISFLEFTKLLAQANRIPTRVKKKDIPFW
jgi:hypothetical protein